MGFLPGIGDIRKDPFGGFLNLNDNNISEAKLKIDVDPRASREDFLTILKGGVYGSEYGWGDGYYEQGVLCFRKAVLNSATPLKECYLQGIEFLYQAAEKGDVRAEFMLGQCYEMGAGVQKNSFEAIQWYEKAASQGNQEAQNRLESLKADVSTNQHHPTVLEQLDAFLTKHAPEPHVHSSAERHGPLLSSASSKYFNPGAILNGYRCFVRQNYQHAYSWCHAAAEWGDALCQYILGLYYEHGKGVDKNLSKAIEWYKKAADQGVQLALIRLKELDVSNDQHPPQTLDHQQIEAIIKKLLLENGMQIPENFTALSPMEAPPLSLSSSSFPPFNLKNLASYRMVSRFTVEHRLNFKHWVEATKRASDNDVPSAQYNLALLHYLGIGLAIEQDYAKALELFEKAADAGHIWARYWLGVCFAEGKTGAWLGENRGSYEKASDHWAPAAHQGHRGARYNLAILFAKGRIPQNLEFAKGWFSLVGDIYSEFNNACIDFHEGNFENAMQKLRALEKRGHPKVLMLKEKGILYGKSPTEITRELANEKGWAYGFLSPNTLIWLRKVMHGKHFGEELFDFSMEHQFHQEKESVFVMGNKKQHQFERPISNKSTEKLQAAADRGDREAQFFLSRRLASSEKKSDIRQARFWLEKSAHQGFAWAQFELGCYYRNEIRQWDKAAEWFLKAAQQGNPYAQVSLGYAFAHGEGVNENLEAAFKWYLRAAEQGFSPAFFRVGLCYLHGLGTPRDPQAFSWFERGALEGELNAQYELAGCYERGDGTSRDTRLAIDWYKQAAANGHKKAHSHRSSMRWV